MNNQNKRTISIVFVLSTSLFLCICNSSTVNANHETNADKKASDEKVLHGIWEHRKFSINGTEEKAERGNYLILRKDGTFKIVKRGRKSEGKWSVKPNHQLLFDSTENGHKKGFQATWTIKKETLTLKIIPSKYAVVLIELIKSDLKTEPIKPKPFE